MINTLIVDDHVVVREGIRQMLESAPDIRVGGEAGNTVEMFERLKEERYDVVLLDIQLPGKSGLEVVEELGELYENVATLIISMYDEEQYAINAVKKGALGYLTKNVREETLVEAVRAAANGKRYITREMSERLARNLDESDKPKYEKLSDRELEVLKLLAEGKKLGEIAEMKELSVKTISTYRTRMCEKLNLKTSTDIVKYAIQEGLVDGSL
jgi:DNA-binding NarL/FixJ family response regulator